MSILAAWIDWRREHRKLADDVTAACEAFERRCGLPATHAVVAPNTGYPPPGCGLVWRESSLMDPGIIRVGVTAEARP